MKKAQIYFLAILIIILIIVIYLDYSTSPSLTVIRAPETPNPVAKEMETVSFCGTDYQVEKIMIDGVDIIKRIAELATVQVERYICDELRDNVSSTILSIKINEKTQDETWLDTGGPTFIIHSSLNRIWKDDPFGGYFVGTIK